ncbi:DUF3168 domain-containing protein [Sphingomonas sp. RB3P16]|uniref:tail completion protein gp17 n=1 Tax=Parasphingomonas frigoris TaxID=3096163 RepID=UPI002FC7BEE2
MDMEGALRARLLAAAPVTDLVERRVTWIDRPQKDGLPAITLQIVTDERVQTYSGFAGLQPGYVQVDVWALTYAAAKALKEAIIGTDASPGALVSGGTFYGIRFTRAFVTARDLSERTDTQFIYRHSIDLNFHYATA